MEQPIKQSFLAGILVIQLSPLGADELEPNASETPDSEQAASSFTLSGYGTLAYTADDAGHLAFVRELTQRPITNRTPPKTAPWLTDSRFGVQGVYQLNPSSEVVALFSLRDQEETNFNNSLEWAYLGLHPKPSIDLRLGRVGYDAFLMSDHRQLGFAYPWIRPPTEFYGALPAYSVDGADIAYRLDDADGEGSWRIKAQLGSSATAFPFGFTSSYDFEADVWSISLTRQQGPWRLRAGYSEIDIGSDPAPLLPLYAQLDAAATLLPEAGSLRNDMTYKGTLMKFSALGVAYDDGTWIAQAELGRVETSASMVTNGTSGYLTLGRQLGEWTPYVSYSAVKPLESARTTNTAGLQQAVGILNSTRLDQSTWSLGARWDFNPKAALKFQWDQTQIDDNGYGLWWTSANRPPDSTVNVYTLSLDFLF